MREDFQKDFLKLFRSYGTVSSLSIDYIINYLSIVPLITRVRDVDVKKKIKIFGNKFKLELTWSTTIYGGRPSTFKVLLRSALFPPRLTTSLVRQERPQGPCCVVSACA